MTPAVGSASEYNWLQLILLGICIGIVLFLVWKILQSLYNLVWCVVCCCCCRRTVSIASTTVNGKISNASRTVNGKISNASRTVNGKTSIASTTATGKTSNGFRAAAARRGNDVIQAIDNGTVFQHFDRRSWFNGTEITGSQQEQELLAAYLSDSSDDSNSESDSDSD
jgi:hypothetical protein